MPDVLINLTACHLFPDSMVVPLYSLLGKGLVCRIEIILPVKTKRCEPNANFAEFVKLMLWEFHIKVIQLNPRDMRLLTCWTCRFLGVVAAEN